jgi:PAS domain S-box-containing protein
MAGETILIVEDEWILSMNLQNMLKSMGYNVLDPASTGEEAIASVSTHRPDLILMDISLSGQMDGIEASHHIGSISDVPIIFLSSHSEGKIIQDAKTALPYGYLIKPVLDRELSIAIEMALNRNLMDRCLRESEERFRNLFQNVGSVAVLGYGADGAIRYWNLAAEHLYGYTPQEAIGRNILELIIPQQMQTSVMQSIQQMTATGQALPPSQQTLIRKDKSAVPVYSSYTVLKSTGRMAEFFNIDIDLSEHHRIEKEKMALEEQNHRLQKAESLGRMAGAIAHLFNNMLGAAIGNLDLAMMELPPDSIIAESLNEAMKACNRAAEVSGLMLTYLGQTQGKKEVLDLSEACIHSLSMLRTVVPENQDIKHALA